MFGYATVIPFKIAFPKFLMGGEKKKALLLRMLQAAAWKGLCMAEEPASTATARLLGACWNACHGGLLITHAPFLSDQPVHF